MVHAAENVIFITHLRSDNAVPAETASDGIVRNRIIREQLLNQRREWNGIKARQDSIVGIGIRHKSDTRQPQPPAKTFVIRKKERFISPYWTAEARAELILAERRQLRAIEGPPRIQHAVAKVFEDRTMKLIGSGPRHSIDRGACAAKLCTVGIRLG